MALLNFDSLTDYGNYGVTPELGAGLNALSSASAVANPATSALQNSWLRNSGFLGSDGNQGWGGMALGAAGGLGNLYLGLQQYGLAKDTLQFNKDQFAANYGAQRLSYNTQLEDRQRARVAATNGGAESVSSYMDRNRLN